MDKTLQFHVRLIQETYFAQCLTIYFLIWNIVNLNVTLAVYRKRNSKSLY